MRQKVFYQAAPLFFLLSWQGYAASAFTCTTFTEGEASKYLIGLTTSSFNNGGDITGTTFDFASTNYDPFFVDETGAAIPFTMPPGTAFRINNFLVNNAGTLAAGTIAGGVYFIKADGSYTLIDPPPAPYSVAWINGFNNNEELTGVLQSKSASGPEAYVGFFRRHGRKLQHARCNTGSTILSGTGLSRRLDRHRRDSGKQRTANAERTIHPAGFSRGSAQQRGNSNEL